ncbi:MAG: amino acid adenylation domain-containing protein [Lachnospiraceae bacterium]|nr:amino acid adenylation domain-containing protein [Lachnospiraceae bacterium]
MEINVLEFLENTTEVYGDKTAVKDITGQRSFREMHRNSQKIGSSLIRHGVFGKVVPVFMEKSILALEAFFGIVYAGAGYSLLSPIHPDERVLSILDILQSPVVITDLSHYERLREIAYQGNILLVEELLKEDINWEDLRDVRSRHINTDALYVNFTSGSTGVPKGVVVSHRSTIEFVHYFVELFNISDSDIIGNQAPFDFDVSVKDIYSMLLTGATLYIIPREMFLEPKKLLDILEDEKITTLIWAVSALCIITSLKGFNYKIPKHVNKVLFSGEIMPATHFKEWHKALPEAMFVNLYGPTEITCNCTYYVVSEQEDVENGIPIGKAFPNERVFLLDEKGEQITAPNREGEICVSGTTVGLGYFRDKEKTDVAFLQNPLNDMYNETCYRTGDLAYYREDGNLIYVGRKDFQIKHMGHRIELFELDSHIENVPGVERVCCLYNHQKQQIVAIYQGEAEKSIIKTELRKKVMKHMIPDKFIKVEALPLNKNGKIDRKELTKMYIEV